MENNIEDLCEACMRGNTKEVKERLTIGSNEVDINDTYDGCTPLMWAIKYNQVDTLKFLLTCSELQLYKTTRDRFGNTALHLASCYDYVPILRLVCQDRRCTPTIVNMKNRWGETALMMAVDRGFLDVVKEMEMLEGTDFYKGQQRENPDRCFQDE